MLAAINGNHLPGDGPRLPKVADGSAEFGQFRAPPENKAIHLGGKVAIALPNILQGRPGPIALTRMRGASACAIICVAVHSVDLESA
jgi:hypothetical protein